MELLFLIVIEEVVRGDGYLEMLVVKIEDDVEDEVVEIIFIVVEDDGGVKYLFVKLLVFNIILEDVEVFFLFEEDVLEEFDVVNNEVDNVVFEEVWSFGFDNIDVVEGIGDNLYFVEVGLLVVFKVDIDGMIEVGVGFVFWDMMIGRVEIVFVEILLEVIVVII